MKTLNWLIKYSTIIIIQSNFHMKCIGQTSSQAQIGFRPESANANQGSNIFNGGGQASAQSGVTSGQSQSQISGSFK